MGTHNGHGRTRWYVNGDIDAVWREHRKQPSNCTRNRLARLYLPLVWNDAERVYATLPIGAEIDIEDLRSAGVFGLMDAIEHFDHNRGVKFKTYAAPRIRGAMRDELRRMDRVPRSVRSRASQVAHAHERLVKKLGRALSDEELQEELGVAPRQFEKLRRDARVVGVVSLSRKWFETDTNKYVREIDILPDANQRNPFTEAQKRDLFDFITRGLSRVERTIVILYYYQEMRMKDIGAAVDLSESRVSQVHSSVLARLRAQLDHQVQTDLY